MSSENTTANGVAVASAVPEPSATNTTTNAPCPLARPFMNGNVIDGKAVAAQIREETAARVAELKARYNRVRTCL